MVRMKVKVVGLDQNTLIPVVVITDMEESGFIPILIGPAEAQAISSEIDRNKPQRPMTHDLLKNILDQLNAKVERVVISDLKEEVYYARLQLKTEKGVVDIDARPSDAIALALRADAPIYVTEEVAARAVISNKKTDDEMEQFRRFLENVKPEDFQRNLRE
ncbi:MAG: bifunctional nuclease family protein [Firmicutes bacterium]|nr:bifunctional nuclease family protein [Bacillota bacterium]